MKAGSPLIALVAAVLVASSVLPGCSERFDGFTVEGRGMRSDIRIVPMAPRRYDELRFEVSPKRYEAASGSVSPRVDGAILKIEGFLPLRADVSESDGGYVVAFSLPKEGLRAFNVRRAQAQLHLPTDIGQLSWTITPHAESLCAAPTKLPAPQGMPLFVAFPFPPAEDVRQARLVVPVTVLPPDPPVQRSVRPEKRIELYEPHVDAARLGEHTLHATVHLR
jgi:hypothetical protein